MSGGHFDYGCFKISQFADELKHEIETNNVKDEFGDATDFSEKTLALLTTSHQIIEIAGKLAREIEWLFSGDHSEETAQDLIAKNFRECILNTNSANIKFIELPMKFQKGQRVIYVPAHAKNNLSHPDCQLGVISSINDQYVFVKYDNSMCKMTTGDEPYTAQATKPEDLRLS